MNIVATPSAKTEATVIPNSYATDNVLTDQILDLWRRVPIHRATHA